LQDLLQQVHADDRTRGEIRELADTLRDNLGKIVQHGRRADAIIKKLCCRTRVKVLGNTDPLISMR
jgi:two-component system, NtrC family, sensor kinase